MHSLMNNLVNLTLSTKVVLTGFQVVTGYPKLKSFWSCSHMNCCQHYMLHINLYIPYSLWSVKLATLFSATGGNFSAIHIDYVDFVPELGWRFRSRNL